MKLKRGRAVKRLLEKERAPRKQKQKAQKAREFAATLAGEGARLTAFPLDFC